MKLFDLLNVIETGFEDEESVWVYMRIDGIREKVVVIYEHKIEFPHGSPYRFLNANVERIMCDKNEDRKTIAVFLESDVDV